MSAPTSEAKATVPQTTSTLVASKFMRPGKVVILLNGRHAGKKAFVVGPLDVQSLAPNKQKSFGHALVVGLARSPKTITKKMNKQKSRARCRVYPFIKVVNYNHMMPTRYSFDLDVKSLITPEVVVDSSKRKEACSVLSKKLEERYRLGYNKWFFQKLRF